MDGEGQGMGWEKCWVKGEKGVGGVGGCWERRGEEYARYVVWDRWIGGGDGMGMGERSVREGGRYCGRGNGDGRKGC